MARKPKAIETPGDVSPKEDVSPAAKVAAKIMAQPDGEYIAGRRVLGRRWGLVCLEGIGWIAETPGAD